MANGVKISGLCLSCEFESDLSGQGPVPALKDVEQHLEQKPCNYIKDGKCEAVSFLIKKVLAQNAVESGI